jgi:hypothetical protein
MEFRLPHHKSSWIVSIFNSVDRTLLCSCSARLTSRLIPASSFADSQHDELWNVSREVNAADDAAARDKSIKHSIAGALQVNGATGDVVIEKK